MNLVDIVRGVEFEFGIGDPTFFGWFTVVAYLVACGLAAANAWRVEGRRGARAQRWLWWGLALLLLFLAVNKQLDIQSYFTAVGRAIARAQGWYELRGMVQLLFVAAVALVAVAAIAFIAWALRDGLRQQRLTLIGITMILAFVLVRASSFHYIDILIGLEIAGFRMNWVFELGAIAVFSVAAYRQLQRPPAEPIETSQQAVGPTFDRRWRLGALVALGAMSLLGAAGLMVANAATPIVELEPERRSYEGVVPDYTLPTGSTRFAEPFSGSPAAPRTWPERDWDVTVHSRNFSTWRRLDEMEAAYGDDCGPPPATHTVSGYDEAVFQCDDRLVTAINATGFGAVYLTPDHLIDVADGGTIRWRMSTERTSPSDWVTVWISPYEDHRQLPLLSWLSDLGGPPERGLYLEMGFDGNNFVAQQFTGHQGVELPVADFDPYDSVLEPSATALTTFEITLSPTRLRMGLPEHDLWWVDTELAEPLDWSRAVVQFAHLSSNPTKECEGEDVCAPNSWQWDDVEIEPAVPFTALPADADFLDITRTPEVTFEQPAPEDAHLRFAGTGEDIEVSVDGGFTWEPARRQKQASDQGGFQSYWHPVPAGTWYVRFRADNQLDWHIRDISIWSPYVESP